MEAIIMLFQSLVPDASVLLMPAITIAGSGLASYVGNKIAIAEIKIKQENHEKRLDRLEARYFEH